MLLFYPSLVHRGSGQYFDDEILELVNQVPIALADKAAQAIRKDKPFLAVIVNPLFPEGYGHAAH